MNKKFEAVNFISGDTINMYMDKGDIVDMKGISEFKKLKHIKIFNRFFNNYYHFTVNIDEIAELELYSLELGSTSIPDISFIKDMESLKVVVLSSCSITDITHLKKLRLERLWLYNNKITDISVFDQMDISGIYELSLKNNDIQDYTPLITADSLTHLNIGTVSSEPDKLKINESNIEIPPHAIPVIQKLKNLVVLNNAEDWKDIILDHKISLLESHRESKI